MNHAVRGTLLILSALGVASAETPRAETYLHSGKLDLGEQALEAVQRKHPDDDRTRFGLGVVKVVHAVERFGQSLYEYGAKSGTMRLPIAENPSPAPIDYRRFRRVLDDFRRDLVAAETTLADIDDEDLKLSLRLADVRLDFDGDGEATDRFLDLLERGLRQRDFDFLKDNPEFLVRFDRGDVAWLRGYCHLLCGVLDAVLAFDGQTAFDQSADEMFAKPVKSSDEAEDIEKLDDVRLHAIEPLRLARTRRHFITVCELNRETWQHVRSETDDDHEWLPNAEQTGVLGLPVNETMITAWLLMVDEVQATLEGKRAFLKMWIERDGKGLDLAALLDDPPTVWSPSDDFPPNRYFTLDRDVNIFVVIGGLQAFGNSAMGYAIWFN